MDNEDNIKNERLLSFMMAEYNSLKKYAGNIIRCQTTYLWGSLAAAGVSIGLGAELIKNNEISDNIAVYMALSFFSPLILLTLASCLYFDKVSLLSRIYAYIRVLENIIIDFDNKKHLFCGFENYTKKYRTEVSKIYYDDHINLVGNNEKWNNEYYINKFIIATRPRLKKFIEHAVLISDSGLVKIFTFKMPNQQIYLSWLLYAMLSIVCLMLVFFTLLNSNIGYISKHIVIFFSLSVLMFSLIYTLYIVRELVDGNSRSQSRREMQCENILNNINEPLNTNENLTEKNYIITWPFFLWFIGLLYFSIHYYLG